MIGKIAYRLSRRKVFTVNTEGEIMESHQGTGPKLSRVLSAFDLTLLGVGSTLGVGIYVLAGSVAKDIAGPAVCLSFLIAAAASAIAAVCYAEFGARVPKAGSAYVYSYVTVGELVGFIIGWNLILEYLIGTASVARAMSCNVDAMLNHSLSEALLKKAPIHVSFLSPYADWLSLCVTIFMTVILSIGVKSSSLFTNIFTFLNLGVVTFFIVTGLFSADYRNWQLPSYNNGTISMRGTGGFMPFGWSGVMAGAAKCFFGFVGFDSIAAAGEEAKDAKRSVPLSIMLTLLIVLVSYVGVSVVLTLMVPYYLQDKDTPLVTALQEHSQSWASWIIIVGSVFGLTASLLGSLMPLPRIVYAMAKDGLLFRFLATVHPKFKTPFTATLFTGLVAALFAMITELDALIDMMSIGTLLAYTLVAVSILILRYEYDCRKDDLDADVAWRSNQPDQRTCRHSKIIIAAYCVLSVVFSTLATFIGHGTNAVYYWLVTFLIVFAILMIGCILYLYSLPKSRQTVYFTVPLVPFLPCVSILINIFLMLQLSALTWIRFIVWMFLGMLLYGCYGVSHSNLESHLLSDVEECEDLSPLVAPELSPVD